MSYIYNQDAEQAILGALLLDRGTDTADQVFIRLNGNGFSTANRELFEAAKTLHEAGTPIDLVTLSNRLAELGIRETIGGIGYLSHLAQAIPSVANTVHYISILEGIELKQKAIRALEEQRRLLDEEPDAKKAVTSIHIAVEELNSQVRQERSFTHIADVMKDHEDELDIRSQNKGLTGVPTCGAELNKLTGGRQKQDLVIVAARPSVGKTAFMLNDALSASLKGTAVGIFSLEMKAQKLGERMIANIGNLDGSLIRTGHLNADDWRRYTEARSIFGELPIYIDDTPGQTVQQIGIKAKELKRRNEDLIIMIDYLQLISGGKQFQSREQEISFITRMLKQIARDNDCPVIALSQLSRSVEQRQDKRPMLSDLRESGSIEQDADEVDFLYRDDYYNAETEKKNIVEIIVAKGRNTGTGLVEMVYLRNYSKFCDVHFTS